MVGLHTIHCTSLNVAGSCPLLSTPLPEWGPAHQQVPFWALDPPCPTLIPGGRLNPFCCPGPSSMGPQPTLSLCQDTLSLPLYPVKASSPLSELFLPQSGCPRSLTFICKSFV